MKKLSGGIRKLLETWGLGLEVNSCSRKEKKIVENICFDIIIIALYLFLFFFILCLTVV